MRALSTAVVGGGLVLALAGCGGGDSATAATPPPTSASPTPSASPTLDSAALSHQLNLRTLKIGCASIGSALRYVDQGQVELGAATAKQAITSLQGIDKTDDDVAVDSTGLVLDLSYTQFVPADATSFGQVRTDYSNICLTKRGFPAN